MSEVVEDSQNALNTIVIPEMPVKKKWTYKKCEHDKKKSNCKECGGSQICVHGKIRAYCKDCGGSTYCTHGRIKFSCKECGGSQICEHGKRRSICKECGGGTICEHGRQKDMCKECGGKQICIHKRLRYDCIDCKGNGICMHNKLKRRCKECKGNGICEHGKRKIYCKQCGGSSLCKSPWCETLKNKRYDGHCLSCFVNLFPDRPNARNYKTKERSVVDYVFQQFPQDSYSWIADKRIQDGCSRKRPDLLLDLGYQVIIVEVDENQHIDYDCSCENKRIMQLSQDVGHRPMIFIRFNPDEYTASENKVTSCWGIDGLGICAIKKTKQKEWKERLEALRAQIEYWISPENKTEKTVEVIQLFYDCS